MFFKEILHFSLSVYNYNVLFSQFSKSTQIILIIALFTTLIRGT